MECWVPLIREASPKAVSATVLPAVIWLTVTHGGPESKKRHVLLWGVYGKSTGKPRETTQPMGPTATTGPTASTGTTIASQWMHTLHLINLLYILQVILNFCIYILQVLFIQSLVHASARRVWKTGLTNKEMHVRCSGENEPPTGEPAVEKGVVL